MTKPMPEPGNQRPSLTRRTSVRIVPALATLLLMGCAMVAERHTHMADGKAAWAITCGDQKTLCFMRADKLCPKGYQTIEETPVNQGSVSLVSDLVLIAATPNYKPVEQRIVVVCEDGAGFRQWTGK